MTNTRLKLIYPTQICNFAHYLIMGGIIPRAVVITTLLEETDNLTYDFTQYNYAHGCIHAHLLMLIRWG